jgi:hypothetical protein
MGVSLGLEWEESGKRVGREWEESERRVGGEWEWECNQYIYYL